MNRSHLNWNMLFAGCAGLCWTHVLGPSPVSQTLPTALGPRLSTTDPWPFIPFPCWRGRSACSSAPSTSSHFGQRSNRHSSCCPGLRTTTRVSEGLQSGRDHTWGMMKTKLGLCCSSTARRTSCCPTRTSRKWLILKRDRIHPDAFNTRGLTKSSTSWFYQNIPKSTSQKLATSFQRSFRDIAIVDAIHVF